jgi:cytochrome c oxidase subunit 2
VRTPLRSRPRLQITAGAIGVATLALAGCSSTMGAPEPVSEQGSAMTDTWRVFLVGAILVSGLVWGLVLWSVVRYRRRSHDDATIPRQRQYNIGLEALYTIVPVLIVAGLFALTVVNVDRLDGSSSEPELTVTVVGFQWQWQFRYGDQDVAVSGTEDVRPVLMLPVGRTVRFQLEAADVIHSFWVPEFLTKRDLIPGLDNSIEVEVIEEGEWVGRCAEYCGFDHWRMTFDVKAVPADEFDRWLADARDAPQPILGAL